MKKVKVIDFYADWCQPCKMVLPIINQLIEEFKDNEQVEVVKINVDENSELAKSNSVRSIPTIIFYVDDVETHRINGATNKKTILDKINECLN